MHKFVDSVQIFYFKKQVRLLNNKKNFFNIKHMYIKYVYIVSYYHIYYLYTFKVYDTIHCELQ